LIDGPDNERWSLVGAAGHISGGSLSAQRTFDLRAYVALSRMRSRDRLSLARPLRSSDIRVDPWVNGFMIWFGSDDPERQWGGVDRLIEQP
jgi:hypothetical protein